MKKLVLMAAVVFSMSFFACGNKEQAAEVPAEEVAPVEEVAAVEATVDTLANAAGDTTVVADVEAEVAPVEEAK